MCKMTVYYPEVERDISIPSKKFKNDQKAITHFKQKYSDLIAVIKDEDPKIEVIWEKDF